MTDTRPLLLGYVRAHLLMTEAELSDTKRALAKFADVEGYTLGTVYVERIDRARSAFQALMDALRREEARAVVVPGMHHLTVLEPPSLKDHLEYCTGARVLTARHTP